MGELSVEPAKNIYQIVRLAITKVNAIGASKVFSSWQLEIRMAARVVTLVNIS
jgi:hypothetical protein